MTDQKVEPGDVLQVEAEFDRVFPWEATAEEFLEQFEVDTMQALTDAGFDGEVTWAIVQLADEGVVSTTWAATLRVRLDVVPTMVDPTTQEAGFPLIAVVVAIVGVLGFVIAYRVTDSELIKQTRGALDSGATAAAEARKLALVLGGIAFTIWIISKTGKAA